MKPRLLEVQKLGILNRMIEEDSVDPMIVEFASRLARPYPPDNFAQIARSIYRWVRDGIRMQRDPNLKEDFASAMDVLRKGYDDCDGKVHLAASLLRALGLDARAWPIWTADGYLKHVQLWVKFPGSYRIRGAQPDGALIGDPTIDGAELGDDVRRIAPSPRTGKFPFAGGPHRVF